MTTQRQRKTATHSNLRRLRKFLLLTQKEMADRGACSPAMIQSVEIGRKPLSVAIASQISESTNIDLAWLMSDDPRAPMINTAGEPYSYDADFKQRHRVAPDAAHYRWRELQLGVDFDLHLRELAAWRRKGKEAVEAYMQRCADFHKAELKLLPKLEDTIHGERRRAKEAALLKTGRIIPLGDLTPSDMKPLQRGREKLAQSIAAFTAREARKARR
jgi:transcriptional regulator with XRE-family HTH domain